MDDTSDPRLLEAEGLFDQAVAAHQEGDLERAADGYRRVVSLAPQHKQAYNNLGTALKTLKRYREAVQAYRHAIEIDPAYAAAIYNLGTTHHATGQFALAFACFQRADHLRPGDANTLYNMALIAEMARLFDYADALFARVAEISPDHLNAIIGRARCQSELGRHTDALTQIEPVIRTHPDDARYWCFAGEIHQAAGDWEQACLYFQKALCLAPNALDARMALASALLMGKRFTDAASVCETVIRDFPGYLPAHVLISRSLQAIGLDREAAEHASTGQRAPGVASTWLNHALMMPCLPSDEAEINRSRAKFYDGLSKAELFGGRIADPTTALNFLPFFFAYQGLDDKPLMSALAGTLTRLCPDLEWQAPRFVSAHPDPND